MADCNRVTPFGAIEAIDQWGLYLGNRGSIHRDRSIVRPGRCVDASPATSSTRAGWHRRWLA